MSMADSTRASKKKVKKTRKKRARTSVRRSAGGKAERAREAKAVSGEKVVVTCICGKKYRVPERRAGKTFGCRMCGRDVHIPREAAVSMRSRNAILAELGVDPEAAAEEYQSERAVSTRRRREEIEQSAPVARYRCTECREPIEDPKTAYEVTNGLICESCKADEVVHRDQAFDPTDKPKLDEWVKAEPQSETISAGKSAAYFALFFLGFTGLSRYIFDGVMLTWVLPGLVAALGSYLIYSQMKPSTSS